MAELLAGTSGFAYPSWKPEFYPDKLAQKKFLGHYATRLNAVEINYTFRRTPSEKTLTNWIDQTPDNFQFSIKAHQRLTHMKRLKDAEEATDFFLQSLDPLKQANRLGVVLFQLPPYFKVAVERLKVFLGHLPKDLRSAFEFRHESWNDAAVYDALKDHNACFCQAESEKIVAPEVVTADFVYFRLRKTDYSQAERDEVFEKASGYLDEGKTIFLFFKHEDTPAGVLYAEELLARAK